MYNKLVGGQCIIYDKTSHWQLQNSGHWFTQLYFKIYTITARKDKWTFSLHYKFVTDSYWHLKSLFLQTLQ